MATNSWEQPHTGDILDASDNEDGGLVKRERTCFVDNGEIVCEDRYTTIAERCRQYGYEEDLLADAFQRLQFDMDANSNL